jgi:hypothetical protein
LNSDLQVLYTWPSGDHAPTPNSWRRSR